VWFQTHPCGVEVTLSYDTEVKDLAFQTHPCGVEVNRTSSGNRSRSRFRRTLVGLKSF